MTTSFCKARGRLVLQMQDLSFLEKLDFRLFTQKRNIKYWNY